MSLSSAPRTPRARTAAVVLNWRAPVMSLEAVRRAFDQTLPPDHIYVVDNASGDESPDVLRRGLLPYGDSVTLLVNDRNLGFGGGCNTALRAILAEKFDYAWLLNNDASPEPSCLATLVDVANATADIGAVGSLMIDPGAPDTNHFGSWLHPLLLTTHHLRTEEDLIRHPFAWLTAASMLIAMPALRAVGLFDERYFMYWEDADLSMRLRKAGYSLRIAPGARVVHVAGTSSRNIASQRYLWHLESQQRFIGSHHRFARAISLWLRMKYLIVAAKDRDFKRMAAILQS